MMHRRHLLTVGVRAVTVFSPPSCFSILSHTSDSIRAVPQSQCPHRRPRHSSVGLAQSTQPAGPMLEAKQRKKHFINYGCTFIYGHTFCAGWNDPFIHWRQARQCSPQFVSYILFALALLMHFFQHRPAANTALRSHFTGLQAPQHQAGSVCSLNICVRVTLSPLSLSIHIHLFST